MSYFPTDIPFMSEEELKANGIKVNSSEEPNSSGLQKCPFCGKAAKVKVCGHAVKTKRLDGEEPYFKVTYKLGCFDCDITFTHESQFEADANGKVKIIVDGYKVAAEKWNRRG